MSTLKCLKFMFVFLHLLGLVIILVAVALPKWFTTSPGSYSSLFALYCDGDCECVKEFSHSNNRWIGTFAVFVGIAGIILSTIALPFSVRRNSPEGFINIGIVNIFGSLIGASGLGVLTYFFWNSDCKIIREIGLPIPLFTVGLIIVLFTGVFSIVIAKFTRTKQEESEDSATREQAPFTDLFGERSFKNNTSSFLSFGSRED
ncbi:unnamed protein product [Bursaphelenchus xylophilus]|uniref:(pine wood nematode) hypothetical protein n=1 Tax=Bursaphelenchus xylophilus TaxID=6326 RepID=A0A1I7S984_BURXY|nr:unnamed protein product [Bursaphelenchus xylophilus]CAG9100433.1 unnamed protein product [Bursaphelenchus xylophilus]